jgi:hypothetical protein
MDAKYLFQILVDYPLFPSGLVIYHGGQQQPPGVASQKQLRTASSNASPPSLCGFSEPPAAAGLLLSLGCVGDGVPASLPESPLIVKSRAPARRDDSAA